MSDNFALAELQNEPVLVIPREPGLRVPAEASVGLSPMDGERGFVPISTMVPDEQSALEFADDQAGFGAASGHVHDVTDMVSVLGGHRPYDCGPHHCGRALDPGARVLGQVPDHVRQGP